MTWVIPMHHTVRAKMVLQSDQNMMTPQMRKSNLLLVHRFSFKNFLFRSHWEIFLNLLQDIVNNWQSIQGDMRSVRRVWSDELREDAIVNRDAILRVHNCSEVDVAGIFFKQDGKYYDYCCDSENKDASECAEEFDFSWLVWLGFGLWFLLICLGPFLCPCLCRRFWDCAWDKCNNRIYCRVCCEPQSIVRNFCNATRYRTERSNISTISANIRQPPSRPRSPSAPPLSEIQVDPFDQLPRSKATEDQCTGRSKYFFWNL